MVAGAPELMKDNDLVHVLVVMGEGGHSKQCLRLVDLMGTTRYRYSYILVAEDAVTLSKLRVPGPVYRVRRPGSVKSSVLEQVARLPLCTLQAAFALARLHPDVVLTTGPAVAVPVSLIAKLVRARIIYIESCSRIQHLSTTGKIMRYLADLYFVQWEELLPAVPKAVFAGRLF
jgi:beta-1,4-N-acetylglucosaminyltransferase